MRRLVCRSCGEPVDVHEIPFEWIDPERFRCIPCLDPRHAPQQLELPDNVVPIRREAPSYNPAQARIPY